MSENKDPVRELIINHYTKKLRWYLTALTLDEWLGNLGCKEGEKKEE